MSNPPVTNPEDSRPVSREEMLSAMFANMIIQQTNMAMMLMGKVAHPETGQFMNDLEAARMFIDQLEMLEAKTKGNLTKQEEALMKQALSALHMTFVEAVDAPAGADSQIHTPDAAPAAHEILETPPAHVAPDAETAKPMMQTTPEKPSSDMGDDSRKKFSKKY